MGKLSFQGRDLRALLKGVVDAGLVPSEPPAELSIGNPLRRVEPRADWLERSLGVRLLAAFANDDVLSVEADTQTVHLDLDPTPDPDRLVALFRELPFETAEVSAIYPEWHYGVGEEPWGIPNTGFLLGHAAHGLACALKGKGHERLASERLLHHGPWRLIQHGDLSFVQFHDPSADAATARRQALPGIQAMGYRRGAGAGVLLGAMHVYSHDLKGRYSSEGRLHRILVAGRDLSLAEMQDACELRYRDRNRAKDPIEQVAFVFAYEADARKHLHDLWLRGLSCRTIASGGREILLDEDYAPRSDPPEWVRTLAAPSRSG